MKIKKPNFWDEKEPNFLSYLLLPLTIPLMINNFFLKFKNDKNNKNKKIKTICVGNIYLGGTGKTPLSIKLSNILNDLNCNSAIIKKYYSDQLDEQNLLEKNLKVFCEKNRKIALNKAIDNNTQIAIFDDGLQDRSINYDMSFVCFNNTSWIGNGFLIPAGPLREKFKSIKKYDAIFLNGNNEDISHLKSKIKKENQNIKIFESIYSPINIDKF